MTDANAEHMEPRVTALEDGLGAVRREVSALKDTLNTALLGTLDGKPGIMQTLSSSLDASRANAVKLDNLTHRMDGHSDQLEGLRLDRAQVRGIIITVSVLWAVFGGILGLVIKFVK